MFRNSKFFCLKIDYNFFKKSYWKFDIIMFKVCLMMMIFLDYVIIGNKNSSFYCGFYSLLNCVINIGYIKENYYLFCLFICSMG